MRERNFGLDLIRATAVSLVLVCHFASNIQTYFNTKTWVWIGGSGLIGVELFFVLSGFLIGGILLDIVRDGPTVRGWFVFLVRRGMRTLPLYFAWMIVMAYLTPPPPGETLNYFLRYGLMMQNFAWPIQPDNWFGVSWSLAIEEWFYLLFSSALFLVAAIDRRRAPWIVVGLFITIPLAMRIWAGDPATFMAMRNGTVIFHIDAIAYGVLLALLRGSFLFQYPKTFFAVGFVLVGACWDTFSYHHLSIDAALFLPTFTSVMCLGFALCFPLVIAMKTPHQILAVSIRWLSTHSYGIYIMHLTILTLFGGQVMVHGMNALLSIPLTLGTIFAAAALSYKLFEEPILLARPSQNRAISRQASPQVP